MPHEASISFGTRFREGAASNVSLYLDKRLLWAGLLTCCGYYLGSLVGFALTFRPHPVSVLWPPNSILLAALLLTPPRAWLVLLLAAFPAHVVSQLQSHVPLPMMFCYFITNSCEALIGAGCIRYLVRDPIRFDSQRSTTIFCLFGAVIAPFLSSFLDAGFIRLNHWGAGSYGEIWRIRFFSNVLTALTFAPAIVIWFAPVNRPARGNPKRRIEVGLAFVGLLAVCYFALYKEAPPADPVLFCAPFIFLLWAALRLGRRATSSAILIVTFLTIWSAARGHGPFTAYSPEENARSIQLFLVVMTIPFLFLIAGIAERRSAENLFRLATESSPSGMMLIDAGGQIVLVNAHVEELFGYKRDELIGRRVDMLVPERFTKSDSTLHIDLPAASKSGAIGPERGLFGLRKNGKEFPVEVGLNPVPTPEGVLTLVTIVDISTRKAAEEEARIHRDQIDLLSRVSLLGEMTASLAHELNQPLSAIVSNATAGIRFLEKDPVDLETVREILNDVTSDSRRAHEVISNVRNTVKKGGAIREKINANEVVKKVARMVHPDAATNSCKIETSLTPDLPPFEGDPVQIQQVLINLVGNAFDAMRGTPIGRRKVELVTQRTIDGSVRVSVRDHGPGVPEEERDRLFDHFFTTKEEGLGMGLAIVRSIVEAHGGRIAAENVDGGGACFHFTLAPYGRS